MYKLTKEEIRVLQQILSLPTTSFHEQYIQEFILHFVQKLELDIKTDVFGNILVHYVNGISEKPPVFSAHMDHPGFSVLEAIRPNEYFAQFYGGTNRDFFPGAKLLVYNGENYIEAVADSPMFDYWEDWDVYNQDPANYSTNLLKNAEKFERTEEKKLLAPIFKIVTRESVKLNSIGFFDVPFFNVKGDLLYTKNADDVVNAGALLILLSRAVNNKLNGEFYCLFTRAEEVGFIGAQAAIETNLLPENCIPIVTETSSELEHAKIGQGVILRVGDRYLTYSSDVDSWMYEVAIDSAKDDGFRYQRALMDGGTCEASLFMTNGFDTGALALALGNYHNIGKNSPAPEFISLTDLNCLINFAQKISETPFSNKRKKYLAARISSRFQKFQKYFDDNPFSSMSTDA